MNAINTKKKKLKIEYEAYTLAAESEPCCESTGLENPARQETCGDLICTCKLPAGKTVFIISDGMGKGKTAAAKSKAVVLNLKKLLKQGLSPTKAIRIVNKRLIEKDEVFATIDMMILDENTGRANFYKMGAAKSFVVKSGKIRVVQSEALPVGIISKLVFHRTTTVLRPGDMVVMMSDGITEADRGDLNCLWLQEYLRNPEYGRQPENIAQTIVGEALARQGTCEKDDMSVIAIAVR